MKQFLLTAAKNIIKAALYLMMGGLTVLLIIFVLFLEHRPDLDIWHKAELDAEFTKDSPVADFAGYLALEEKLFRQLEEQVYAKVRPEDSHLLNRYDHGSLTDPARWPQNWNRTFELSHAAPKAGVLLLHGMSDSPYSLRNIGLRLHEKGAAVVGLRIPGHGTAPSGLVEVRWQDMAAAVRLAMNHLQKTCSGRPLYIVGYSNGSALAVHYSLVALEDPGLPMPKGLILISPAIGVTPLAAFAVWQARLGHLLGLDKLAWNSIEIEYDPFKYNSFAVNAGDQVYRLTSDIQNLLNKNMKTGRLKDFPSILAFLTVVDTTVSPASLITGLFEKLPADGHELVLFDINRINHAARFFISDPKPYLEKLFNQTDLSYTLSLVANADESSRRINVRRKEAGSDEINVIPLDMSWPEGVHSLSHIALPFPVTDPLYGKNPTTGNPGINLGNIALLGERGVLEIPASAMLRLRWNPFYADLEKRVLEFIGLQQLSN